MVCRNRQTKLRLGGLDQTKTKSDQTIPITVRDYSISINHNSSQEDEDLSYIHNSGVQVDRDASSAGGGASAP
jgi:hypothetical protein